MGESEELEREGGMRGSEGLEGSAGCHCSVELQTSLVNFAKKRAPKARREFNAALEWQDAARCRKEEIALQRKLDSTQEEYIVAIYFWEQFHSPCC